MSEKTVISDGQQFEYDVAIPAAEVRPLVLADVIENASVRGTYLTRDLYILEREGTDKWVIFGSDGIIHDLDPNEPIYVKFLDTAEIETELVVKKRDIREAIAKYG